MEELEGIQANCLELAKMLRERSFNRNHDPVVTAGVLIDLLNSVHTLAHWVEQLADE